MVCGYVDLRTDAKKTRVEKDIGLHIYIIVYHIVWDPTSHHIKSYTFNTQVLNHGALYGSDYLTLF